MRGDFVGGRREKSGTTTLEIVSNDFVLAGQQNERSINTGVGKVLAKFWSFLD